MYENRRREERNVRLRRRGLKGKDVKVPYGGRKQTVEDEKTLQKDEGDRKIKRKT